MMMKKLSVVLLAMALLILVGCASGTASGKAEEAEEPVYEAIPLAELPLMERLPGDWYAENQGLLITLSLTEGGAYTLSIPGKEAQSGSWALSDSLLILDGDAANALMPIGDSIRWASAGLLFTKEMPDVYVPAEIRSDLKSGDLDGYWKSRFVAVGEGTVLSSAIGENTDVYIEGTRAALGGPLFGDVIVDTELKDGALLCTAEGVTVKLALQADGLMRLTMTSEGSPVTLYLYPVEPDAAQDG